MKIKPIILSGGSGIRLWPLSRKNMPKQFVDLFNKNINLFKETLERVKNDNYTKPLIISSKAQRYDILKHVREAKIKVDKIILEDSPKNTAPACCIASHFCKDEDVLCFLPSENFLEHMRLYEGLYLVYASQ